MKTRTKERENFIMSVNYKKILNLQMKQTGLFSVVAVRVFLKDVEVHRLGRYTLPSTVNDINREMFFTVSEQLYLMTLKKLFRNFYFYFYFHLSHTIALLNGTGFSEKSQGTAPNNYNAEQQDRNFLLYIKNKFKFLYAADKIVTLVVDEINMKPYFEYKGGNIVCTAFNTFAAATSAFLIMVCSNVSKFKDVYI